MSLELLEQLEDIQMRIQKVLPNLHVDQKRQKLMELEELTTHENFWQNREHAQSILKQAESLKDELSYWESIEQDIKDLLELLTAAVDEKDEGALHDLEGEIASARKEFRTREVQALLSDKHDEEGAVLAIHAGTGGLDAQDWAEMLMRMYLRFFEKMGFKASVVHESRSDEAGIKSATIEVQGRYAFGYLKSENGVHRLVRLSPFNSDNLRQTSFALVEVYPLFEKAPDIELDPKDLRIDTFRASGAGGQHVNKTDSAVRIVHEPTKISVEVQSERSQAQNKDRAMKILAAKLHRYEEEQQAEERDKLRGEYSQAVWGNQIRSYVLHPYKMAKDHRTKKQVSSVDKVLDGALFPFVEAYLQHLASEKNKDV